MVEGNHDRVKALSADKLGLDCILQSAIIKLGKHIIELSHYPYKYGFWKGLYTNVKNFLTKGYWPPKHRYAKNPIDRGNWLIHGHTHSKDKVRGKQIHVGVDAWDGYPVSHQEILDIINKY